jgi:hypothetical protein
MTDQIEIPPGLVVVTTYGQITGATHECLLHAVRYNENNGIKGVEYRTIHGTLVDRARNDAVRQMLDTTFGPTKAGWLLFIDGDMTFTPDAIQALLVSAFHHRKDADMMGAYCNLKGDPHLPTIDTGTGTWEVHYPNEGILEVIRTGGAFVLIKRHVLETLPQPWFSTRTPERALDHLYEVDNFARCKLSGDNPFREMPGQPWEKLERAARDDRGSVQGIWRPSEVGEDSAFCDRVRANGFRIFVNTDIATGHVETRVLSWEHHKQAMDKRVKDERLMVGVMA